MSAEVVSLRPSTSDEWAARIRGHLARTVESIIAAGRDLAEAKASLPHGEWLPMLAKAGVNDSTARKMMAVAGHPVLANQERVHDLPLPPSWGTLYELTKVPEPELTAAIEAGVVRPDMPRKEAAALARGRVAAGNRRAPVPVPEGQFATIVADPPWRYGNTSTRGAAEDHYKTLSIEELCDLDVDGQTVDERAADQSHLYLWATAGHLPEAFNVMEAWGFTYKTYIVWVKPQMGMGNYFRISTELVLFGVKGGLRTSDRGLMNYFEARRSKHSAKPEKFVTDIVLKASPGPYLELFARCRRDSELACNCTRCEYGWTVWGDQS